MSSTVPLFPKTVPIFVGDVVDRDTFQALLKRRFFYTESFEIYRSAPDWTGDNKGLYDYGPPGCALQANIVDLWRKHFVIEEEMCELDCTTITPEDVFKTSGHVERFADWMCKDSVTGDYLRADHLVEDVLRARLETHKIPNEEIDEYDEILAKIESYDGPELGDLIERLDIRSPQTNNEMLPPIPFNLMFKSTIGPSTAAPIYLRPETAQGQFLNFRKCLEFNGNSMPFASASIGKSYRNEVSPRSGLLRVREFLMAEVEHFVDPEGGKKHTRFDEVQDTVLSLLDRDTQLVGMIDTQEITIGEAVKDGMVDNETLGYFLARIQSFLVKIGIDRGRLRFRQHLANEMAHYACDCWDAELLMSYGWIECVGCADRSAYDLTVHSKRTGQALVVKEARSPPVTIEEWQATLDKKQLGPRFRKDAKVIEKAVEALDQATLSDLASQLEDRGVITITVTGMTDGQTSAELTKDLITIERQTRVEHTREYTPNVIEPSFGIGRILYSLLEHSYWRRPSDPSSGIRGVLSLPISVAPTKVLILPLSTHPSLIQPTKTLTKRLRSLGIASRVDSSSASIGKRYARNDELGTPLGVTIDSETVKDGSVTLRERDSMAQVRASQEEILRTVRTLVEGVETWNEVLGRLPKFAGRAEAEEEEEEGM